MTKQIQLTKPQKNNVYAYKGQYATTEDAREAAKNAMANGAKHAYYTRVVVHKETWYHLRVCLSECYNY
jgi:hypothetical protein